MHNCGDRSRFLMLSEDFSWMRQRYGKQQLFALGYTVKPMRKKARSLHSLRQFGSERILLCTYSPAD